MNADKMTALADDVNKKDYEKNLKIIHDKIKDAAEKGEYAIFEGSLSTLVSVKLIQEGFSLTEMYPDRSQSNLYGVHISWHPQEVREIIEKSNN